MNRKCYKSVILALNFPLLLIERLKILQQAAISPLAAISGSGQVRYADRAFLVSSHACLSRSLRRF